MSIRKIHDEIMADLETKGFGGYIDRLHDYKNGSIRQHLPPYDTTYTQPKTKNASPAGFYLLPAGSPSFLKVI
jgi:hypothetical protein